MIFSAGTLHLVDEPSRPIGIYARTKPVVTEVPLHEGTVVVVISDGVFEAGVRRGQRIELTQVVAPLLAEPILAQTVADGLLKVAVGLDDGRLQDDSSVLVLACLPGDGDDPVRRLHVSFPVP
jgi:serine phosphatase RsbU (regulator of sigma subunit)